jgi:hypothetical protein
MLVATRVDTLPGHPEILIMRNCFSASRVVEDIETSIEGSEGFQ